MDELSDDDIRGILGGKPRVALVGASDRPSRPSHQVMGFLLAQGFDVTPVNPVLAGQLIHGRTVVAALADAAPLDMVDVFRKPAEVGPVADEAIALGAKVLWLQLGVIAPEAADRARQAGLTVVIDRCPAIEIPRLKVSARRNA